MSYYHYCAYWGTWSRVLGSVNGATVEVNLTPIPNCHTSTWANHVAPIVIRRHRTPLDTKDKCVSYLPVEIRGKMYTNLDFDLVYRLLTEDFFSHIDWEKYEFHCKGGGGVPFEKCRK